MRLHVSQRVVEPRSPDELLMRARLLAGRTAQEVASELGVSVPEDLRRAKGFWGRLSEKYLGADAGNASVPDFESLGIELKTLPVDSAGKVKESTFISSMSFSGMTQVDWDDSPVRKKLLNVLWVPVESDRKITLPERRFGSPFLWSPSQEDEDILRNDWEVLVELICTGQVEQITGHLGKILQIRPKAAHSRIQSHAPDEGHGYILSVPKGFYLRARFTETLLTKIR